MKTIQPVVVIIGLIAATQFAGAQEALPRDEAMRIACYLGADLKQITGTPIPTDVDLKYAVAVHEGDSGAMVLPECKLSADTLSKAGKDVVPLGQLWFRRLTPAKGDEATPASKLQFIKIQTEQEPATGVRCALGFKKGESGPQLLIYGSGKEPLLTIALKKTDAEQKIPIQISAKRIEGDAANVTLKIVGGYEGTFKVMPLPE